MVPVPADHPAHVVDRELFPGLVPNVLPARNLFQDEQADFIAGVQKMAGLRIVRCTNDIAFQLLAQNLCVATLNATRHRLTHPREGLMSIKPAQLDDLAVEFKTVVGKLGPAETESA